MANQFELADVLKHISSQLEQADRAARTGGNPVMQFDECEVEFAVKIEASGKAGVQVWVLEFGGEAKREQSNMVKIKFKAIPGMPVQAPQTGHDQPAPSVERQTSRQAS